MFSSVSNVKIASSEKGQTKLRLFRYGSGKKGKIGSLLRVKVYKEIWCFRSLGLKAMSTNLASLLHQLTKSENP